MSDNHPVEDAVPAPLLQQSSEPARTGTPPAKRRKTASPQASTSHVPAQSRVTPRRPARKGKTVDPSANGPGAAKEATGKGSEKDLAFTDRENTGKETARTYKALPGKGKEVDTEIVDNKSADVSGGSSDEGTVVMKGGDVGGGADDDGDMDSETEVAGNLAETKGSRKGEHVVMLVGPTLTSS